MKKRLEITALTDKHSSRVLFLCCFCFYFLIYLGRLNYSAALAGITSSGFLEKDAAGLISTSFFICYGAGQFFSGFTADRLSPFELVAFGILMAGGANLLMYLSLKLGAGLGVYMAIWAVNGIVQSTVWPTMIRIISNILPEDMRVSAAVSMLATTAVGTVLSYLLSTLVMSIAGWRECFLVPGLILAAAGVTWYLITLPISKKSRRYVEVLDMTVSEVKDDAPRPKGDLRRLLELMIASGVIIMFIPTAAMSIIKDGITTWTPTIITEQFMTKPEFASLVSSLIPLISLFGAVLSKLFMEKLLHDELKSSALMFALAGLMFILLFLVGSLNIFVMLVLLALVIALMLGVNTMVISLVPLRFGKYGCSATMTGIMNSIAATSCGVSTYIAGLISKIYSWDVVFGVFLGLCAVGLVLSLVVVRRWIRFKQK